MNGPASSQVFPQYYVVRGREEELAYRCARKYITVLGWGEMDI